MTAPSAPVAPSGERSRSPGARWAFVALLVAAEVAAVASRYWWSQATAPYRPWIAPLLCAAAGLAAFAAGCAWRDRHLLARVPAAARIPVAVVGVQIGVWALFAAITYGLAAPRADLSGWLRGAWFVAGAAAVGLAVVALAPPGVWARWVKRSPSAFAAWAATGPACWFAASRLGTLWADGVFVEATMAAVAATLSLFYADARCVPAERLVGANGFDVTILDACSGYEGLGLVFAFLTAYTVLARRHLRFPQAFLLVPLALAVSWGLNVGRIVALVAIGAAGRPEIAAGGFHSQAGWLAFNAVALGAVLLSLGLPFFRRPNESQPVPVRAADPATPLLLPLVAFVACGMATAAATDGTFDPYYAVRVAAAGAVLVRFRRAYADLGWTWTGVPTAVAAGLGVFALWVAADGSAAGTGPPEGLAGLPAWAAAVWLAARVLGAVVVVPLAEELAFRAYPLGVLCGPARPRVRLVAVVLSSAAFGALHPGREAVGFAAGLVFAGLYLRRGRAADAVVAHAAANAALAAFVLATGRWEYW